MKKFIQKHTGSKNKFVNWLMLHYAIFVIFCFIAFFYCVFKFGIK